MSNKLIRHILCIIIFVTVLHITAMDTGLSVEASLILPDTKTTFFRVQELQKAMENVLEDKRKKQRIHWVTTGGERSRLPIVCQGQMEKGLSVSFADDGVPIELNTPWGTVPLVGTYHA